MAKIDFFIIFRKYQISAFTIILVKYSSRYNGYLERVILECLLAMAEMRGGGEGAE